MDADAMIESENKALIRRWFNEVWNQGRQDLIDQLRAPDAIANGLGESYTHRRRRIVEAWNNLDYLQLLIQIGAVPINAEQDRFWAVIRRTKATHNLDIGGLQQAM